MSGPTTITANTPLPDDGRLERARAWFDMIRRDGPGALPKFAPVAVADDSLTPAERLAVGRSLAAPDLCAVAASPPAADRIARATARLAALTGERVLLIAEPDARRARLAELRPGMEARRRGRWWSREFWRAGSDVITHYDRLAEELSAVEPPGLTVTPLDQLMTTPGRWERVIVTQADRLSAGEALYLAARSDRWVFLGDPNVLDGWWGELRATLADESWVREGDRLRCRLQHNADRSVLSSELVTDAPSVEIRIGPGAELAEVVFSAGTTLLDAKEFLAEQVEAWPIDLDGATVTWDEKPDQIVALTGAAAPIQVSPREITRGVRELIAERPGPIPWYTCGLAFNRAAGWDRGTAEAWIVEHFPGAGRLITV